MQANSWRRWAHSAVPLLLLFTYAPTGSAQQATTVEPTYTRVFGSDTMDISNPAVSPDGRWLAFSVMHNPEESSLWIIPAAGGTPSRLTSPGHFDGAPTWMPGGDRILFPSNRPSRGEPKMYGMVLPMDPATGRATAQPRQLTLDPTNGAIKPSPDGRWVLYVTHDGQNFRLKVMPAAGGNARLIAHHDLWIFGPTWSGDGQSIYYSIRAVGSNDRIITRIGATGGTPREMFRVPQTVRAIAHSGHVLTTEDGGGWPPRMTLHDPSGRPIANIPIEGRKRPVAFTPDGRGVLLMENQTTAAIRVVPVQGGQYRAVTRGHAYDWPLGWTPNGSAVIAETLVDEKRAVVIGPVSGGTPRTVVMPVDVPGSTFLTAVGNVVGFAVPVRGSDAYRLVAFDLESQQQTVLSEGMLRGSGTTVSGPGGVWRQGNRFLFAERKGDQIEVRSASGSGDSRVIRSLPASTLGRSSYAVHGERVAWWTVRDDSSFLMLADGPTAAPRVIVAAAGTGGAEIAWSWDGRRIASHWPADRDRSTARIMALDVPAPGQRATPRLIETGALYYYFLRWLPDNSGLVMVAGYGIGVQSHILHVPIREGDLPVVVTRDDPSLKWGYELSADGRTVAYPGEIPGGTAIWRGELGAAFATR